MNRLLLLALPALLAGCPKQPPTADVTAPVVTAAPAAAKDAPKVEFGEAGTIRAAGTLPKFHWRLLSATDARGRRIDALFARPEQPVTLDFKQGRVGVSNSCNGMGGTFQLRGKALTIAELTSTLRACADPKLMALDAELGKRLQGTLGLRLSMGEAPVQLELKTASGDVLVFAANEAPERGQALRL